MKIEDMPRQEHEESALTMIPVESTNIAAIGYADDMLHVQFKNGGLYTYAGVPRGTFNDFLAAKSAGSFFFNSIKGKFDHVKVPDKPKEEVKTDK